MHQELTESYSQTGRAHLLLVSRTPGKAGGAIGVITLEGLYLSYFEPQSLIHIPMNRYNRSKPPLLYQVKRI